MHFRAVLKQDCEGSLLEGRYVMNLWENLTMGATVKFSTVKFRYIAAPWHSFTDTRKYIPIARPPRPWVGRSARKSP
jgi:hypothetical protein